MDVLGIFGYIMFGNYNVDNFNEDEYFATYDNYGKYDSNKIYEKEEYNMDYGKGMRRYRNYAYILTPQREQRTNGNNKLLYVVAVEVLPNNLQELYAKYCQCDCCRMSWWNPVRALMCSHCYGCIKCNPTQYTIRKTRDYIMAYNITQETENNDKEENNKIYDIKWYTDRCLSNLKWYANEYLYNINTMWKFLIKF